MTLTTIVLAAATVSVAASKHLARSFEARQSEWNDDSTESECDRCDHCCVSDMNMAGDEAYLDEAWAAPQTCADRSDDDHCYRELFRALVEAQEANQDYYEVSYVSPSGASFATSTVVRRPLR